MLRQRGSHAVRLEALQNCWLAFQAESRLGMAAPDFSWQAARSQENLTAGEELLGKNLLNAAASRFYYALYHAAWFLLARKGEDPRVRIPSRKDDHEAADSWPHKYLRANAYLIATSHPNPLAEQMFRRSIDECYRKFYTHRVNADYMACGATGARLKSDSTGLRKLLDDLLA